MGYQDNTRKIQQDHLDSNETSQVRWSQEKEIFGGKGNADLFLTFSIFLREIVQTKL